MFAPAAFALLASGLVISRLPRRNRHTSDDDLRRASETLGAVIASSPAAIYTVDRDGIVLTWNPAAERIFGWNARDILGRRAPMVLDPSQEELERIRARILNGDAVTGLELAVPRRDGSTVQISVSAAPVFEQGAVSRIVAVATDITEQRRSQTALRESEERLARAQAIAHLGSWELELKDLENISANSLWWSDEVYRIFGYEPGSVSVSNDLFFESVPAEDRPRIVAAVRETLESGVSSRLKHRIVRPDGSQAVVEEQYGVLRSASGRPLRLVGTVQDVTQREKLEDELREALKLEAVARLASGVAHDFNNLIASILGTAELALEGLAAERPERSDIEAIRGEALRAASLTRELIAFSRPDGSSPSIIQLNDLVVQLEPALRRMLGGITLRLELEPNVGVICADLAGVERVIANTVATARTSIEDGERDGAVGEVTIRTENVDDTLGPCVALVVTDTGRGMSAAMQARVVTGRSGGLGLATVYGLVEQMGGAVQVSSEPGQGTTVRALFPRIPATQTMKN